MSTVDHHQACEWPWEPSYCNALEDQSCPPDLPMLERVKDISRDMLWTLTGRRYGICSRTVRPCSPRCQGTTYGADGPLFGPVLVQGQWKNCGTCGDCGDCDCCTAGCREVDLGGLIQGVTNVTVDGVTLGPSLYRVDDHQKLVRLPGTVAHRDFRNAFTGPIDATMCTEDGLWCVSQNPALVVLDPWQGRGMRLFNDGVGYIIDSPAVNRADLTVDLEVGAGGAVLSILALGGAGSDRGYEVDVLGGGMTVTYVGQQVTIGPQTIDNDTPRVRVRHTGGGQVEAFSITPLTGFGQVLLTDANWTEIGSGKAACWPTCQDMSLRDGEVGTWSVTYDYGLPVPPGGVYAYTVYACELYKAVKGLRCRLPTQVESIAREGIRIDLNQRRATNNLLAAGLTGIAEVDNWIKSVNPFGLTQPSSVYSPDVRRHRVTTSPWGAS